MSQMSAHKLVPPPQKDIYIEVKSTVKRDDVQEAAKCQPRFKQHSIKCLVIICIPWWMHVLHHYN
jgi:hypothetical protein